ncbi:MAG: hypothetical protein F6J94_29350 [Moorea sp. SIO1F2]|uniref:protealysin inhibitor emfourin n=1 Tax=Moorena sp. SIO1F2 TaxID=2607819 RepID=UPI0013BE1B6D|nr:protealysin inhibitor emfourin [Moorena sp. SIO1F2]NET85848.1 hypothetical protein [Moorena sp. SIO1F2]
MVQDLRSKDYGGVMKIYFERSGGFMGMNMATEVDTESLSPEEADQLQGLLNTNSFFELPAQLMSSTPGADQFSYKLTVEVAGRKKTVEIGDTAVPEMLQPLLRRLTTMARSRSN